MGALQPGHLIVILVIVLLLFGPGKLGEVSAQLGRGIRELREGTEGREEPKAVPRATRYCSSCGSAATVGASFCSECGKELDGAA